MTEECEYSGYFKGHVAATFSKVWVEYDSQFIYNQLRLIDRFVPLKSLAQRRVLEVGSGAGRLTYLLKEFGFIEYTGLELDKDACKFTQETFGSSSYNFYPKSIADFHKENPDGFDTIFSLETLEHLTQPLDDIKKMADMLSPKGLFIGTTPFPFKKNILSDTTHYSVLHPENWRRLFEKAGFQVKVIRPMTFLPYLWRINRKLNVILPFYFPGGRLVSTSLIIAEKSP